AHRSRARAPRARAADQGASFAARRTRTRARERRRGWRERGATWAHPTVRGRARAWSMEERLAPRDPIAPVAALSSTVPGDERSRRPRIVSIGDATRTHDETRDPAKEK